MNLNDFNALTYTCYYSARACNEKGDIVRQNVANKSDGIGKRIIFNSLTYLRTILQRANCEQVK